MSNLIVIDGVHHAIRGGMHSEEDEISKVYFYRKGYYFTVDIKREDVTGTAFEEQWLPTIQEPKGEPGDVTRWSERWGQHCHLVISQSLPLLADLSAGDDRWLTLEDYLCTPSYEIKMTKSVDTGDAVATVTEGPSTRPAFHFAPFPNGEKALDIRPDLPRYPATEVMVLNQADDYRQSPNLVKLPDGTTHAFVPFGVSVTRMPEKTVGNDSLDSITAHLEAYKHNLTHGLPKVTGIVTTRVLPFRDREVDTLLRGPTPIAGDNVAGILLEHHSDALPLSRIPGIELIAREVRQPWATPPARLKRVPTLVPTSLQVDEWEELLGQTLSQLHTHDITLRSASTSNIFVSDGRPYFAKISGRSRKAVPQYSEDFIKERNRQKEEEKNLSTEGKSPAKSKSYVERRKEEEKAIIGYEIEIAGLQEQKDRDWHDLSNTFRKVRDALSTEAEVG